MKCDGASSGLTHLDVVPRRWGSLFWQNSSLSTSSCVVAPAAQLGAPACATTATEHASKRDSTTLAWPECTQIYLFSYHTNKYLCFTFQEREDFPACQSAWKPCSRALGQSWSSEEKEDFSDAFFQIFTEKISKSTYWHKERGEKGALSSGQSARVHISVAICIWMETLSPELKEKTQFITVAWEIPQVQALTPPLFQQPSSR